MKMNDPGSIYNDGTYYKNNNLWHAEDSSWKGKKILEILLKNNLSLNKICEVGCGAGKILEYLSHKMPNSSFDGYDISADAIKLTRDVSSKKINFLNKEVNEIEKYYDLLLCIDVFEHVRDYMGFIEEIKTKSHYKIFHIPLDISVSSILRGQLMYTRKQVGHLHYFTKETALETLKDVNYEIIDYYYTKSFSQLNSKTKIQKMINLLRQIIYYISPDLMARILGGCSLIVLAK
jgi:ubiquinone/menaquinone biosynthesis C-methylase UbiE